MAPALPESRQADPPRSATAVLEDGSAPLVYIIAGEVSGDLIAGRLIDELNRRTGGTIRFAGIGGERMAAAGIETLFPMAELSLIGVAEVIGRLRGLMRRLRQAEEDIRARQPAVLLCVDASGFARRLCRRLAGAGIARVQYKAPQAWAYFPWRARGLARDFDRLLSILPFEPAFFARYGANSTFIGHPVIESGADRGDGLAFRQRHGIAPDEPVLCLLPGSRWGEIRWALPTYRDTVSRLIAEVPALRLVVPTIEPVAGAVAEAVGGWPWPVTVVPGGAERFDAFAASTVALAASGTVSVELAMAGTPTVVCYRVSRFTAALARVFMTIRYVSIVNLVLDRPVIPELLQGACEPAGLAAHCKRLLTDTAARGAQQAEFREAVGLLKPGGTSPTERAADVLMELIQD